MRSSSEESAIIPATGNRPAPGFLCRRVLRLAVALALLAAALPALAASAGATGEQAGKASASLDFRIVIPETIQIDSRSMRRARSQTFVSRTVQDESGRTVVTVARP